MSYLPPTDLTLGPAWLADAICSQTDPAIFFPEKGESPRQAKRLCGGCDFRAACLGVVAGQPRLRRLRDLRRDHGVGAGTDAPRDEGRVMRAYRWTVFMACGFAAVAFVAMVFATALRGT